MDEHQVIEAYKRRGYCTNNGTTGEGTGGNPRSHQPLNDEWLHACPRCGFLTNLASAATAAKRRTSGSMMIGDGCASKTCLGARGSAHQYWRSRFINRQLDRAISIMSGEARLIVRQRERRENVRTLISDHGKADIIGDVLSMLYYA